MIVTDWFKRNASTILTCIGAGGMVATVVTAVKATPKAMRACTDAKVEKGNTKLTKLEIVKAGGPAYIPTIAIGAGTLMCFFGANALNRHQQALLISAYASLENTFREYRDKVISLTGEETDMFIRKSIKEEHADIEDDRPPWDGPQTFYIEHYGKFFESTMEDVMRAEYHFNRNFKLRGQATFNELLDFLGLEHIKDGDDIGWDEYIGEAHYGYRWIDFEHRRFVSDDMIVVSIDMPFGPHSFEDGEY